MLQYFLFLLQLSGEVRIGFYTTDLTAMWENCFHKFKLKFTISYEQANQDRG